MEESRTAGDVLCELFGGSVDHVVWSYGVSGVEGLMGLGSAMG